MKPMTEGMRLALAAAIAASDDAKQCTARLAGKTIAVETLDQRWLIRFEAGKAQVEHAGQAARPPEAADEADATVRGSLAAVIEAFARDREGAAAVLGDAALFNDFRAAFRPHLPLPASLGQFAEDAGDAVRVGAKAAKSALEGISGSVRSAVRPEREDAAGEIAALRERVDALEARLDLLERSRPGDGEA